MRVLLVEDDPLLGDALHAGLRANGFAVDWVHDGVAADAALQAEPFVAVVLDLGLPRMGGLDVLRKLRARGNRVPVLVLTARDAVSDRVRGLDAAGPKLEVGEVTLDPGAHRVSYRGQDVELQGREFALLQELMANAGRVLSREQLEQRLYEWDRALESNAIEVHVHHLRRKLAPEIIRTVRGVGYFMPRERPAPSLA
jgi:DNA-binding response OmpR family regulator